MPPLVVASTPFIDYAPDLQLLQGPNLYFKQPWSPSKSSSLYKVHSWGAPYFTVNEEGNMTVRPFGNDTKKNEEIDIMESLQEALECGDLRHPSPVIIRFPNILKDRLQRLQSAFEFGIKVLHYENHFQGVYPVKCNQDRFVVDDIVEFGKPYSFGLEAGSKPELLLAMSSLCKGSPDALLVCNGYKDADYVCLALLAKKLLNLKCMIVLEQEEELDLVLNMSKKLCIEPFIGIRAKLNTKHAGHFGETSGENGKFGLSCLQIVSIVQKLQRWKMLNCLQLLHFHIGSQIPSLSVLNDGVSEAAHIYCELSLMGANMQYIDIGGGLGIDYDGSHCAESDMSVGYSMEEYAKEVVKAVKGVCQIKRTRHPILCSESGRALVSHHSVLVFDVLSAEDKHGHTIGDKGVPFEVDSALPTEVRDIQQLLASLVRTMDYEDALEHAKQMKLVCLDMFKQGKLNLMQLASVTSLYEVVSSLVEERRHEMASYAGPGDVGCRRLIQESSYNAIYHINLSVFKSMPDTWAIGQLFPIVPLHRLAEEPTVRALLSDLTCDSDGKITTFVGGEGAGGKRANYMKVHPLQKGKPYFLGMFLGGAYQEALGGMHNLFGSPPVIRVACGNKRGGDRGAMVGDVEVTKVSDGQNICDVLRGMLYEPTTMVENLLVEVRQKCLQSDEEDGEEEALLRRTLVCSFVSSTYLTTNTFVAHSMHQPSVMG